MLKVTFFIKPVHAGQVITLLDKIAIELAMTPVKAASAKSPGVKGAKTEKAMQLLSRTTKPMYAPDVKKFLSTNGLDITNIHGLLKSLVKKKFLRWTKSGYVVVSSS